MGHKNVCVAYVLWLFGGYFGLHHFYLRRYKQAFVWFCLPGGYFGAGWFRDFFRIPEYVRDANDDPDYLRRLAEKMRKTPKPPFSIVRFLGQLVCGNMFAVAVSLAVPNNKDAGMDLNLLPKLLAPFATAVGIWLVGNIGREKGAIWPPIVACYLASPALQFLGIGNAALVSVAGIIVFNWKSKQWRRTPREPLPLWKILLILTLCGALYCSLWASYVYFNMRIVTKDGDEIPVRDAFGNFIKSPAFQQFSENAKHLWRHAWEHGFWSTLHALIESLDPLGEKNALKVLNLEKGASQDEIRARYRELSKKWHPDRVKEQEKKAEAHEKFVEIQQAYEKLSDIKTRRARQNKRSHEAEEESRN